MSKTALRISGVAALVMVTLMAALPASGQELGNDTIALFPKDVGEFAYANLKQARSQKWFPQLEQQILPERFRQFEKFLASAGIDPNSQVDEVAWGLIAQGVTAQTEGTGSTAVPTGDQIVGVALGNFNPSSTEAFFKQQKLPSFKSHGFDLYAFGTGAGPNDLFFLFLDSNTAAFGHRAELEKMLDVRFGNSEGLLQNEKLYGLINELNGSGAVWAVLNPAYTRLAVRQLTPQIEQFPEAAKLITRLQNLMISVQADSGINGKFQAVCSSVEDANTLAQLMQLAFLYQQYQAKQQNPDLAQLLSQASVVPAGDRVTLQMSLTDDQMTSLIQHNTFAFKM
jgi:hypothetical protein